MSRFLDAELLVDCRCELGEGIQWNQDDNRLYWTDIHRAQFFSCDAEGGGLDVTRLPERMGSFAFDPDNQVLAAMESGLFRWDRSKGLWDRLTVFEEDRPTTRLNDGRCDRDGRFLTGGVEETGLKPLTTVIRYHGGAAPEILFTGVGCTNSLAFSPDGGWLYFADTPTGIIRRFPYDRANGSIGPGEVFAHSASGDGLPDGSCVDAAGRLWNARFGGGVVIVFDPLGGEVARVRLPVPNATCVAFGGADLDHVYVTTAREGMSKDAIAEAPLSGGLFRVKPNGAGFPARGLPESRFGMRLFDR